MGPKKIKNLGSLGFLALELSLTLFEEGGPTGPGPGGPDWGWPTGYMVTKRNY